MFSHVLWRCEVRCGRYESTEEYRVVSQGGNTVLIECKHKSASKHIWTLNCVEGKWVVSDGEKINCTSTVVKALKDNADETDTVFHTVPGIRCYVSSCLTDIFTDKRKKPQFDIPEIIHQLRRVQNIEILGVAFTNIGLFVTLELPCELPCVASPAGCPPERPRA